MTGHDYYSFFFHLKIYGGRIKKNKKNEKNRKNNKIKPDNNQARRSALRLIFGPVLFLRFFRFVSDFFCFPCAANKF